MIVDQLGFQISQVIVKILWAIKSDSDRQTPFHFGLGNLIHLLTISIEE